MTDTDKRLPSSVLIKLADDGIRLVTSEIAKDLEHDGALHPPRIRAAAAEVTARQEVLKDYIRHAKDNGHCDYESLAALVADAADAEDALVNLIGVWQNAA